MIDREVYICPKCGKEIVGKHNLNQHLNRNKPCDYVPPPRQKKEPKPRINKAKYKQYEKVGDKFKCPVCGELHDKYGIHYHYVRMHTQEGIQQAKEQGKNFSLGVKSGKYIASFKGKKHTEETKKKISQKMMGNHYNDVNKTGRGKKGRYKGFFCASTYELAYLIYCLDHGIDIQRNTQGFEYEFKGQKHLYYPDFIVNGTYIEIKGFWKEEVDIKANAVTGPIEILYFKDMQYIFDYIRETYNKEVDKNISDLYEQFIPR